GSGPPTGDQGPAPAPALDRRIAHRASQPTRITATTIDTGRNQCTIVCQLPPRAYPAPARPKHQGSTPRKVYAVNRQNGMRATPAGRLMNARARGTTLVQNTAASPWRS